VHRSKKENRRHRNALQYASRGWPVLPLFGIVHGKCECGDPDCRRPGKHPRTKHGLRDATTSREQIKKWWRAHRRSNIGIVTGPASNLLVIDVDGDHGKRAWKKVLRECECSGVDTLTAITGHGRHYFFACNQTITNSAGKVGPNIDVRADGGYVVGVGSTHASGHEYRWKNSKHDIVPLPRQLLQHLITDTDVPPAMTNPIGDILRGQRNTTLTSFAGVMRRRGMCEEAIEAALDIENRRRCKPRLPVIEVSSIAESVSKYAPVFSTSDWPAPPKSAAFHGLAGGIVEVLGRDSEADPAALLCDGLVFFGNAVGSSPHVQVASDRHGANLFLVCVGDTAKGRKGLAFNQSKQLFRLVDREWTENCIVTGLSSGEGLSYAVSGKTNLVGDGPVPRLLVYEPEFGSTLRMMLRQGNTLSPVLRQAWDSTPLGVLTRKEPLKAAASHVSVIANITRPELRDLLTHRDVYGGLVNRFLLAGTHRKGEHPDFGGTPDSSLEPLAKKIRLAMKQARRTKALELSGRGRDQWRDMYRILSAGGSGFLDAIISRAEPQVLRLAAIYTLLDGCGRIDREHLDAAMAVWQFCRQSAEIIFTTKQRSSLEEQIRQLLVNSPEGMTLTQLSAAFSNHKTHESIARVLANLEQGGRACKNRVKTNGRPADLWFSTTREGNR
jgi:hypothetical protein